jgi:hypothetical protein
MATWKKVIVSGSNITELNNDAGYLTVGTLGVPNSFSTASFGGVNLLADSPTGSLNFASSSGQGLTISANAGTDTLTFGLAAIPNTSLANSTISGVSLGNNLADLTAGLGLSSGGTYNGSTARTFIVDTGSAHFVDGARKTISVTDTTGASGIDLTYSSATGVLSGVLQNSSLTVTAGSGLSGGGSVSLGGTTTLTVNSGSLVTFFNSASFAGVSGDVLINGSGVATIQPNSVALGTDTTGNYVATLGTGTGVTIGSNTGEGSTPTIAVNYGSTASTAVQGNTTISLTGTANEVEITGTTAQALGAGPSYTIGLPDNVTIGNNLIVSNNLTVIGTASFQNTTNLEVADRFVLLASGSNTTGDGGLVIQQATQNVGELFGWDSGVSRWSLTSSFNANQGAFTPDAFMAAVTALASTNPNTSGPAARYSANGNIYVSTGDQSIWIYS